MRSLFAFWCGRFRVDADIDPTMLEAMASIEVVGTAMDGLLGA